jgi:hypothetical protein
VPGSQQPPPGQQEQAGHVATTHHLPQAGALAAAPGVPPEIQEDLSWGTSSTEAVEPPASAPAPAGSQYQEGGISWEVAAASAAPPGLGVGHQQHSSGLFKGGTWVMGPDGPVRVEGSAQGLPHHVSLPSVAALQHQPLPTQQPALAHPHPVAPYGDVGGRHAALHAAPGDHAHRYAEVNMHDSTSVSQPGAVVYSSGNGSSSSVEQEQQDQGMMFGSIYSSAAPTQQSEYPYMPDAGSQFQHTSIAYPVVAEVAPPPAGPLDPPAVTSTATPYVPYAPVTQPQHPPPYNSGSAGGPTHSEPQPQLQPSTSAYPPVGEAHSTAPQLGHVPGRPAGAGGRRDEECRFFMLGNCRYGDRCVFSDSVPVRSWHTQQLCPSTCTQLTVCWHGVDLEKVIHMLRRVLSLRLFSPDTLCFRLLLLIHLQVLVPARSTRWPCT